MKPQRIFSNLSHPASTALPCAAHSAFFKPSQVSQVIPPIPVIPMIPMIPVILFFIVLLDFERFVRFLAEGDSLSIYRNFKTNFSAQHHINFRTKFFNFQRKMAKPMLF